MQRRSHESSRIAGLDAIRGVAIALVLLRHAFPDLFGGAGIVGVLIFFVLSGYLITGLLLRDLHSVGRIRYGRFYRNRAIRLLPPLIFMLLGVVAVSLVANPLSDRQGVFKGALLAITYMANLPIDLGSPAVAHLWTLSTEEQFYLVWPLLLALAFRRQSYRWLFLSTTTLIFAAIITSLLLFQSDPGRIYGMFTSWAIGLIIGSACAVYQGRLAPAMQGSWSRAARLIALLILIAACFLVEPKEEWWGYLLFGPVVTVAGAFWVIQMASVKTLTPVWSPLLWLGKVSYAAYLWNYPVALWLDTTGVALSALASIPVTLILAQVSWLAVEAPFNRWRSRLDARQTNKPQTAGASPSAVTGSPEHVLGPPQAPTDKGSGRA